MLDNLKDSLGGLADKVNVDEVVEKVKEVANSKEGREKIEEIKEKVTDYISDKFGKEASADTGPGKAPPSASSPARPHKGHPRNEDALCV